MAPTPIRASPATPPTTPPAIAPVWLPLECEVVGLAVAEPDAEKRCGAVPMVRVTVVFDALECSIPNDGELDCGIEYCVDESGAVVEPC